MKHISSWMTANLLICNSSKTEFLLIENQQQLPYIRNTCLGYVFDEHLTLSGQVSALSESCYSHIDQLRWIRPYLHLSQHHRHVHCSL